MRVMHVLKDLGQGGAQVVVRTMMRGQERLGHEVAVVAEPGDISPSVPGRHYDLPATGSNPRLLPPAVRALRSAVKDFRPDVVHAHNPGILLVTGLATLRGRTTPALATLHGSSIDQYSLNVRTARIAGLPLVACGPAVAHLMAEHGRPVEHTVINGVTLTPQLTPPDQVRRSLGVTDGQVLFVQVGRLTEQKRPLTAIEALAGAEAPAVLALVGGGEMEAEARALALELGVQDRVRLVGVRADAHDVMRAADVVMLSSSFEGLPLALLEAMSLGRPVLGTAAPGIRELIRDRSDGILTGLSAAELSRGIRDLAADAELRAQLGRAARQRSLEFSADRMNEDYEHVYREILRR